jgi:hypothetical protein
MGCASSRHRWGASACTESRFVARGVIIAKKRKRERKHALPAEATDDERLLAAAKRQYTCTNAKGETVCYLSWHTRYGRDGRPLPLTVPEREYLQAAIFRKIKETQPEFSRGSGKKPGSKDKKPRKLEILSTSKTKQTYRANKEENERAKKREKWTVAILPGPDGKDEYVRLDEPDPPEAATSCTKKTPLWFWVAPTEPVDLYDQRFEFKNYYSGDIGYNDDISKEVEADNAWHAERGQQKHERWLARQSGPADE